VHRDKPPDLGQFLKPTLPQSSRSDVTYVVPVVVNCSYCTPDDGYGTCPKHVEWSCNKIKILVLHLVGHFVCMYWLNFMDRMPMKKLVKPASGLVSCNGCHYGTRKSITAFTGDATCPYPEPDQSVQALHPTFWRSVVVLISHLRLGLPSGLLPSDFPPKTLYEALSLSFRPQFCALFGKVEAWMLCLWRILTVKENASLEYPNAQHIV
jgi:hypothetical protein